MEAAIRFSQNSLPHSSDQRFIHADVKNRAFRLCRITSKLEAASVVQYDTVASATRVPPFRAFDWHPHANYENLVAVGGSTGEATLHKLADVADSEPLTLSFAVRPQRLCNAVSISSNHLLATGIDQIRNRAGLNIWDFAQRLPSDVHSTSASRSPSFGKSSLEPLHEIAAGCGVHSLKFFPSAPHLLVAGLKPQAVHLYDLRQASGASGAALQFNTPCIYNLAIDWRDENFFASTSQFAPDPVITLWDRRMIGRANETSLGSPSNDSRQPSDSMIIKNAIDSPGSIWSMRFSKAQRGRLGVLSSTGQLRVYDIGRDSTVQEFRQVEADEQTWEAQLPQKTWLDHTQDVDRATIQPSRTKDLSQVVSFDFTTHLDSNGQPCLITLSGNGDVKLAATAPQPLPLCFAKQSFIMYGSKYLQASLKPSASMEEVSKHFEEAKGKATALSLTPQAKDHGQNDGRLIAEKSSEEEYSWQQDRGFYGRSATIGDLMCFDSIAKARATNGYALDPTLNKSITFQDRWLSSFWQWAEHSSMLNRGSAMVQDNLDFSYLGVHAIWMEDVPSSVLAVRSVGPSSYPSNRRLSMAIEGLARRLQLPHLKQSATEYVANRQLCLYVSGVSWSRIELERSVDDLVQQGQNTEAAFVALMSGETRLAVHALLQGTATQIHQTLALAISGVESRRPQPLSTQEQAHLDSDSDSGGEDETSGDSWLMAVNKSLAGTTDPYARAMLTYVKTSSWTAVLQSKTTLPMKYFVAVAFRNLTDSALTKFVSEQTSRAVEEGNLEGVLFTGIGSVKSIELLHSYANRFQDPQTAVLASAVAIPRYIRDEAAVTRHDRLKEAYRNQLMAWGGECVFRRVEFDVAVAKHAIDHTTSQSLIRPPPPQIRLVCSHCGGGVAHHERAIDEQPEHHSNTSVHDIKGNPLNPDVAAVLGTVCPHCGRKLSMCGICDHPLGQEDSSFMKWFRKEDKARGSDATGTNERMAGSFDTILGAGDRNVNDAVIQNGEEVLTELETEIQRIRCEDKMMENFITVCLDCGHGFHYKHARMWFEGDPDSGFQPRKFCPVPKCDCYCYESLD